MPRLNVEFGWLIDSTISLFYCLSQFGRLRSWEMDNAEWYNCLLTKLLLLEQNLFFMQCNAKGYNFFNAALMKLCCIFFFLNLLKCPIRTFLHRFSFIHFFEFDDKSRMLFFFGDKHNIKTTIATFSI